MLPELCHKCCWETCHYNRCKCVESQSALDVELGPRRSLTIGPYRRYGNGRKRKRAGSSILLKRLAVSWDRCVCVSGVSDTECRRCARSGIGSCAQCPWHDGTTTKRRHSRKKSTCDLYGKSWVLHAVFRARAPWLEYQPALANSSTTLYCGQIYTNGTPKRVIADTATLSGHLLQEPWSIVRGLAMHTSTAYTAVAAEVSSEQSFWVGRILKIEIIRKKPVLFVVTYTSELGVGNGPGSSCGFSRVRQTWFAYGGDAKG